MTFSVDTLKAHIEHNTPIAESPLQQRVLQYRARSAAYNSIFDGITYKGDADNRSNYDHFKQYFLLRYILEQKQARLNSEARYSQAIIDEKKRVANEIEILNNILDEERYKSKDYLDLKVYLHSLLEEKTDHRHFLMSRFGKFCAATFALGNGLGLGMVGYIIAEKLGGNAFMIAGLTVGLTVLVGINILAFYFKSKKKDPAYQQKLLYLIALDVVIASLLPCAYFFDFLPIYATSLMISSLLLGAYVTTQANFDVTRDNNQRILRKRYLQHAHKSDVRYSLKEKFALFSAMMIVFVSSVVGGLFTYDLVFDLFTDTSLKHAMNRDSAASFSAILGIGSFFTIGIVFYEFAKAKTLSASNFQYLILLKNLILAKNVNDVTIPENLKPAANNDSIAQSIIDAKEKCNDVSTTQNYIAFFTTFILPVAVIAGAIFQQFVVVDILTDILKSMNFPQASTSSYTLCITAGIGYVYMFVPAAINTFIKIAYGVPRIGGYDTLSSEAKVRYQMKRAGNTIMNGLEATLGGMFLTHDPLTLAVITLVAMMTSFVMSDIEGERDRVTDKLATSMHNLQTTTTSMTSNSLVSVPSAPTSRVTFAYDLTLKAGLDGCKKLNPNGTLRGETISFATAH